MQNGAILEFVWRFLHQKCIKIGFVFGHPRKLHPLFPTPSVGLFPLFNIFFAAARLFSVTLSALRRHPPSPSKPRARCVAYSLGPAMSRKK